VRKREIKFYLSLGKKNISIEKSSDQKSTNLKVLKKLFLEKCKIKNIIYKKLKKMSNLVLFVTIVKK